MHTLTHAETGQEVAFESQEQAAHFLAEIPDSKMWRGAAQAADETESAPRPAAVRRTAATKK